MTSRGARKSSGTAQAPAAQAESSGFCPASKLQGSTARPAAGAGGPGREQLSLPVIETIRQHRQHSIFGLEVQVGSDADRSEPEISVGEHDALGPAGGARGIK